MPSSPDALFSPTAVIGTHHDQTWPLNSLLLAVADRCCTAAGRARIG
ncbi:MAG: hypothetical protein ACK56I_33045 [bacterium]